MASTATTSAYPLPPPHWRLFRPDCQVRVLPPRPPSEGAQVFVFGEPHTLHPATEGLDKDDELCDVDGELRGQLLRLHRMLQTCVHDLVRSAIEDPSENARHIRHYNTIMRNLITLLDVARKREASLLVLDRLRDQISRKDEYISHAAAALPGLQADVSVILGLEAVPHLEEPPPTLTPVEPLVTAAVAEAVRRATVEADASLMRPAEQELSAATQSDVFVAGRDALTKSAVAPPLANLLAQRAVLSDVAPSSIQQKHNPNYHRSSAASAGASVVDKVEADIVADSRFADGRAASAMSSSSELGAPAASKLAASDNAGLPDAYPTGSAKVSTDPVASVADSDTADLAEHPQGAGTRPGKRRRLTIKRD